MSMMLQQRSPIIELHGRILACAWLVLCSGWGSWSVAAEATPAPAVAEQVIAESVKVAKYHELLRHEPSAGYLFDRFVDAWLVEGSLAGLREFLQEQARAVGATTGDRLLYAIFLAEQGADVAALEAFAGARRSAPDDARVWFLQAEVQARTDDVVGAMEALHHASALAPGDELRVRIGTLLGRMQARSGAGEAAVATWRDLLQSELADDDLREDLIHIQLAEGFDEAAIATAREFVQASSDPYEQMLRRMLLGDVLQRTGEASAARAAYVGALAASGNDSWVEREILAQIERPFIGEDDLLGLRRYLHELVDEHPQRLGLRRRLAELQAETGAREEAEASYRAILEIAPGDRPAQEALIDLFAASDRGARALEALDRLIAHHPDDPSLLLRRAAIAQQTGRSELVADSIAAWLAASPGELSDHLRAAESYEGYGLAEQADAAYAALPERFPDSSIARDAALDRRFARGDRDGAIAAWQQAAATADAAEGRRIARHLAGQGAKEAAYRIVEQLVDAAATAEAATLDCFIAIAHSTGRFTEAIDAARRHLQLVPLTEAVDAISRLSRLLHLAAEARVQESGSDADAEEVSAGAITTAALIAELQAVTDPDPRQRALLAELLESRLATDAADRVLADGPLDDPLIDAMRLRLLKGRQDWPAAAAVAEGLARSLRRGRLRYLRQAIVLYRRADDHAAALALVPIWKELAPSDPQPWLLEARLHRLAGDSQAALASLRRGCRELPQADSLQERLAQLLLDRGAHAEAERIYWRLYDAAETIDEKLRVAGRLAACADDAHRQQELIGTFEDRRRSNPQSIAPLLALAEIHRRQGDYEARRQALLRAHRLRQDDPDLLRQISRMDAKEGRLDRATTVFAQLAAETDDPRIRLELAGLYIRAGDYAAGRRLLFDSATEAPDQQVIEQTVQELLSELEWELARDLLQDLARHGELGPRLEYLRAVILFRCNQVEAAADLFASLIDRCEKGEMADALPKLFTQPPSWLIRVGAFSPPGTTELFYHIVRQTQILKYWPHDDRRPKQVFVPSDAEDLQVACMTHLRELVRRLEERHRQGLAERLRTIGVPFSDLLLTLPTDDRYNEVLLTAIDDHQDNLAAWACACVMRPTQLTLTNQQVDGAIALFAADYPAVAGFAMLHDFDNDRIDSDLLPLLDSAPLPLTFMTMLSRRTNESSEQLDPAILKRLAGKLLHWRLVDDQTSTGWSWQDGVVCQILLNAKDFTGVVRLFDHRLSGLRHLTAQPNSHWHFRSPSLGLIGMPPWWLPGLPIDALTTLRRSRSDVQDADQQILGQSVITADAAEAAQAIEWRSLRAILLHWLGQEQLLADCLATAHEDEPDESTLRILQAAWLVRGDHALDRQAALRQALLHLDEARRLPLHGRFRLFIDGAMCGLLLELDNLDETVRAIGRRAALHIQRYPVAETEQDKLSAILRKLEIQQDRATTTTSTPLPAPRVSSDAHETEWSPIESLIEQGELRQAESTAIRALFAAAKRGLKAIRIERLKDHRPQALLSLLRRHRLDTAIVEYLEQASDAPGPWAPRAVILQWFGRKTAASQAFDQAIAREPGRSDIRLCAIAFQLEHDTDQLARLVIDLPAANLPRAIKLVLTGIDIKDLGDPLLDIAETVTRLLPQLDQRGRRLVAEQSWALGELLRLTSLLQVGPSGGSPSLTSDHAPARIDAELERRHRSVHERLAIALLDIPSVAQEAFGDLCLRARREERQDDWPLRRWAMHLLGRAREHGEDMPLSDYRPGPIEYLAWDIWLTDDRAWLRDQCKPTLAAADRGAAITYLDALLTLYDCDEASFVDEALAWSRSQRNHRLASNCFDQVRRIHQHRQLDFPLTAFVTGHIGQHSDEGMGLGHGALGDFLHDLVDDHGKSTLRDTLQRLDLAVFGPPDQALPLLLRYRRKGASTNDIPTMRVKAYLGQLSSAIHDFTINIPITAHLNALRLSDMGHSAYLLNSQFESLQRTALEEFDLRCQQFLADTPLLADVDRFDPIIMPSTRLASIWRRLLQAYASWRPERQACFLAWVDQQPDTLGRALLRSALRDDAMALHRMLSDIEERVLDLDRPDHPSAVKIAVRLAHVLDRHATPLADAGLKAVRSTIDAARTRQLEQEAQRLLAAQTTRQLPCDSKQLDDYLTHLFEGISLESAVELWAHCQQLVDSEGRRHYRPWSISLADRVLQRLPPHRALPLYLATRRHPDITLRNIKNLSTALQDCLHQWIDDTVEQDPATATPWIDRLQEVLPAGIEDEVAAEMLLPALIDCGHYGTAFAEESAQAEQTTELQGPLHAAWRCAQAIAQLRYHGPQARAAAVIDDYFSRLSGEPNINDTDRRHLISVLTCQESVREHLPASALFAGLDSYSDLSDAGQGFAPFAVRCLLQQIGRLPATTPGWQESVPRFLQAARHRSSSSSSRSGSASLFVYYYDWLLQQGSIDYDNRYFALAARCWQGPDLQDLIRQREHLQATIDVPVLLAQRGLEAEAVDWLRRYHRKLLPFDSSLRYDASIDALRRRLLAGLDQDGDHEARLACDLVLQALPDTPSYEGSPRHQRVAAALAPVLADSSLPTWRRQWLLLTATGDAACIRALREPLLQTIDEAVIADLVESHDWEAHYRLCHLIAARWSLPLADNEACIAELVERWPHSRAENADRVAERMLMHCSERLIALWRQDPAMAAASALPRGLISCLQQSEVPWELGDCLLAIFLSGNGALLRDWWHGLSEVERQEVRQYFDADSFAELSHLLKGIDRIGPTERNAILFNILTDPTLQDIGGRHLGDFPELWRQGLLTWPQIVQHGPRWAIAATDRRHALQRLASCYRRRQAPAEALIDFWQRALDQEQAIQATSSDQPMPAPNSGTRPERIEALPSAGEVLRRTRCDSDLRAFCRSRLAACLEAAGRHAQARQLLADP